VVIHTSNSPEETQQIAAKLATKLCAGSCIALDGQLGAGKTQFVRGLVIGLGGDSRAVSSPTYVLLNLYPTPRMTVYHLDAYRVAGADDLEAIGFSELLEQGGLVVVEWAERVRTLLPKESIEVRIDVVGENSRRIQIEKLDQ
jgi:tRNA threonylcarbamoyladenosine biosynthesis protein TsaE